MVAKFYEKTNHSLSLSVYASFPFSSSHTFTFWTYQLGEKLAIYFIASIAGLLLGFQLSKSE
jgi:hypothetical protein